MKNRKFVLLSVFILLFFAALFFQETALADDGDTENSGFVIEGTKLISYSGNATVLSIPAQIEIIGIGAFRECISLIDLTINKNCVTIEANAFYNCINLKNVTFVDAENAKLKTIGYMAFARCGTLREITLPQCVENIDECAFLACGQIAGFTLPASLENLGRYAFLSCVNLKSLTLPENLKYLGTGAFNYCIRLESINAAEGNAYFQSRSGVLYNKSGDTLIRYPGGRKNISYSVLSGTKTVAEMAFWDNRYLTILTMPPSIKTLEKRSINDLSENTVLISLVMPENSSDAIKTGAIKYCPNLTITFEA